MYCFFGQVGDACCHRDGLYEGIVWRSRVVLWSLALTELQKRKKADDSSKNNEKDLPLD